VKKRAVVAGVGESTYYERGRAAESEFQLACIAIKNAVADAGLELAEIDGFVSYMEMRNDPMRLATALGCKQLTYTAQPWGGGGNGMASAVMLADSAVSGGYAKHVVAFRALAQGQFGRFGQAGGAGYARGNAAFTATYGLLSPAQICALQTSAFMARYGISQEALCEVAMASYHHAQSNPRAIRYGKPLTREAHLPQPASADPRCLSRFRDGAGGEHTFPTAHKSVVGRDLGAIRRDACGPDVAQFYELTGPVLESEGWRSPRHQAFVRATARRTARCPSSGGNIGEAYIHGFECVVEAVRQVRGESTAQVPNVELSLAVAGPGFAPGSAVLFCAP
jgi:hypothetical protein